ncbi:MAG: U32 family peptidase [Bacteriovoracaceae bacterium]|nr:U32 family peptidase [Bacteriovoracaceae bacterium]
MTHWVPELLAPAGSLEKLKVAVSYGADAVYLGGQKFGLRSAADNFTPSELREGVRFAHLHGSQVYVVLNSFLHDQDFEGLPEFLSLLEDCNVDAVIVSDRGVIEAIKEHSDLVIHLSTQASCLNAAAAKLWKDLGVSRIVLGREVSIDEAKRIKEKVDIELEMFVHGSMCMAYSGNCVISNYTQGRDSNRGGCAHSCRFEYSLTKNDEEKKYAHFMSSKDLQGIRQLDEFINAGIDSLKVEGRMKSHHYAGTISKVYSEALSFYKNSGSFMSDDLYRWEEELSKVSHRSYTSASLEHTAGFDSIFDERQHVSSEANMAAIILEAKEDQYILAEVRSPFHVGDTLEYLPFNGEAIISKVDSIIDASGESFEKSRPGMLLRLPAIKGARAYNIIRVYPGGQL